MATDRTGGFLHPVQRAAVPPDRYESPTTLEAALDLLGELGPAARPVAGGTDLLLELSRGARRGVEVLVDLTRIPGLDRIVVEGDVARLGPLVTHNDVVAHNGLVARALPLAQACLEVGAAQLRNRATVVGNVVTASPANDTISPLLALGASVTSRRAGGERTLPVRDFVTGFRTTALEPGELVTGITVPLLGPDERGIFVKAGLRRAQAISVVHLALVASFDGPVVRGARLAVGCVGPQVLEVPELAEVVTGTELDTATIRAAAEAVVDRTAPIDDIRASADYRREVTAVMVERALVALRDGSERATWPDRPVRLSSPGRGRPSPAAGVSLTATDRITCTVNGAPVTAEVGAGTTLLAWLRDHASREPGACFTGTKEGCAEGECGACTVHLDGAAVLACLVPAGRAAGAEVRTVEGLAPADDRLDPVQQAFVDNAAVQCGYCIPGFLMAADKLLEEHPRPTREEIERGLAGNLCRCTGYYRIVEAVEQAAVAREAGA